MSAFEQTDLPLSGITVLEFSQYLAGPYCGLRLADLGARVIKVERPGSGDACRQLATKNMIQDGDSLVFHTINRNKESFTANLKDPNDLEKVKRLVGQADVMTHNFRPGVMDKIGLDFENAKALNPQLIYGEVSGYGREGPWKDKPGQDLLAQSMSGLSWLSGNQADGPIPFGLAVADMICGTHLAQGIIAALAGRNADSTALRIEVSLMESILDLQFELLTTHFQDGGRLPQRAEKGNAQAYLGAPYGIYPTQNGHIALAMGDLQRLAQLLAIPELAHYSADHTFVKRDQIMDTIRVALALEDSQHWLDILEPADVWCADVFDYAKLLDHDAFKAIGMKQSVKRENGSQLYTTRCPIRIDANRLFNESASPPLGFHTKTIEEEFLSPREGRPLPKAEPVERSKRPNASLQTKESTLPLSGLTVVDFSQFLSGPSASLRLADLGARVIKVERLKGGDICRTLYISDTEIDGESTVFHAINRNKQSYAADLKRESDVSKIRSLVAKADIVMHNFRPGVMQRLGFDYAGVKALNPKVVYGSITGYGSEGPWKDKPGQDLLVQSLSGLTQFSGNRHDGPVPMGIAIVDILAGAQLTHGLLACLARRARTDLGGLVEISMLESALDLQIEPLTLYWQDGGEAIDRTATNNAHPLVGAPYGIYHTSDGHLALAMGSITQLGKLLSCDPLLEYEDSKTWFSQRDAIKSELANHLKTGTTRDWLTLLEPADIWCAEILNYQDLTQHEGYKTLQMEQLIRSPKGNTLKTTRCPIRFNEQLLHSPMGAPSIGEHNAEIDSEFSL